MTTKPKLEEPNPLKSFLEAVGYGVGTIVQIMYVIRNHQSAMDSLQSISTDLDALNELKSTFKDLKKIKQNLNDTKDLLDTKMTDLFIQDSKQCQKFKFSANFGNVFDIDCAYEDSMECTGMQNQMKEVETKINLNNDKLKKAKEQSKILRNKIKLEKDKINNFMQDQWKWQTLSIVLGIIEITLEYDKLSKSSEARNIIQKRIKHIIDTYLQPSIVKYEAGDEVDDQLLYKAEFELDWIKDYTESAIKQANNSMIRGVVGALRFGLELTNTLSGLTSTWKYLTTTTKVVSTGIAVAQGGLCIGNCCIAKWAYEEKCEWKKINKTVCELLNAVEKVRQKAIEHGLLRKHSGRYKVDKKWFKELPSWFD